MQVAARVRRVQTSRKHAAERLDALAPHAPRTVALAPSPRPSRRVAAPLGLALLSLAALTILGVQAWHTPLAAIAPDPPIAPTPPSLAPPSLTIPVDPPREGTPPASQLDTPTPTPIAPPLARPAPRSDVRPPRDLPREPGRLRINLIPFAEVRLDGRPLGRTPIDLSVEPGRHTLELHHPASGQRRERTIDLAAGGDLLVSTW